MESQNVGPTRCISCRHFWRKQSQVGGGAMELASRRFGWFVLRLVEPAESRELNIAPVAHSGNGGRRTKSFPSAGRIFTARSFVHGESDAVEEDPPRGKGIRSRPLPLERASSIASLLLLVTQFTLSATKRQFSFAQTHGRCRCETGY